MTRPAEGGRSAGIDPAGMQKLVTEMRAASDVLRSTAATLEHAMTSVGLSAADAQPVRQVWRWAEEQVPQLRRRLDLARRLDSLEPWVPSTSLVPVDDSLLAAFPSSQAATEAAYQVAGRIRGGGGPLPEDVVEQLSRYGTDPGFAAAFLAALGPEAVADLPARMAGAESDLRLRDAGEAELEALAQRNERALQGLAAVLTAASLPPRPLAREADRVRHEEAAADLAARMLGSDAWGTAQILKRAAGRQFAPSFLAGFAAAADTFDRHRGEEVWRAHAPGRGQGVSAYPGSVGTLGHTDPLDGMVDLMRLLGDNVVAAHRFFTADRIKRLGTGRSWRGGDGGVALGSAFETAATHFRGPGGKGTLDYESAAFTSRMVQMLGQHADHIAPALRQPLARILGSYMPDVFDLVDGAGIIAGDGVFRVDDPLTPEQEIDGAQFTRFSMRPLLVEISRDEAAFQHLAKAATAYGLDQLDAAADRAAKLIAQGVPADESLAEVDTAIRPYAFTMGLLTSTAGAADVGDAERNEANRRTVFALAATPTALLPPFASFVANAIVVGAEDPLLNTGDKANEVRTRYTDKTSPMVQALLDHQVAQALQRKRLFALASARAEADPVRWLQTYEPPPDSPKDWSFLNANHSIKDFGQLNHSSSGSGQVCKRWLDGPAGTVMGDRQSRVATFYRDGSPLRW